MTIKADMPTWEIQSLLLHYNALLHSVNFCHSENAF